MTSPAFGFVFNQIDNDTYPMVLSDFSVLFLCLPSDDALSSVFPLNTPVDINSGDTATLAAMGTGPLYKAVNRINAQLAGLERSARIVVVRVATAKNQDGTEDIDGTITNIIGDPAQGTGMYAVLRAPSLLGVTPRLFGFPGYTGRASYAVQAPVVTAQGSGYSHPVVTFNPAGAAATANIDGSGKITSLTLTSPGKYPTNVAPQVTIADSQGGTGTGATATVTTEMLANPIVAALPPILNALLAHAIVGGPGTTKTAAIAWRGTINSQRIIPVDNWEIVAGTNGNEYIDGAAAALGVGVAVDFDHGGFPFWSFANQPLAGLIGLKRVDALSLLDGATDGQELLAAGIGVTARGDLSDASIDDSGYVLIAYQNASSDTRYNLFNKTRGRDFTNLALIKAIRHRLGKDNITPHDIQAVLNDMTAINLDLRSRDCVIGFKIGFSADSNNADDLRAGRFRVYDNTEEPAPILQVTIDRALDRDALVSEIAEIASASNQVIS